MNDAPSRRELLAGCAAAGAVGLAGCTSDSFDAEDSFTDEYDATDVSRLDVQTVSGNVGVRNEDRETIAVDGTKAATDEGGLEDVSLESASDDGVLTLSVEIDEGLLSFGPEPRIELALVVPDRLPVEVATTNGDVDVELDVPADVTADTTNGEVAVALPATAEPAISFDTTNGDVEIEGFDAEPIDGDSSLETIVGDGTTRIDVETTNGDFVLSGRS